MADCIASRLETELTFYVTADADPRLQVGVVYPVRAIEAFLTRPIASAGFRVVEKNQTDLDTRYRLALEPGWAQQHWSNRF